MEQFPKQLPLSQALNKGLDKGEASEKTLRSDAAAKRRAGDKVIEVNFSSVL